jgi:RNA exonuclease 1
VKDFPTCTEEGVVTTKENRASEIAVENVNQGNRRSKDQASFPTSYYTLTARQMHENGYPKFSLGEEILPGFVRTVPALESVTPLEIIAVDCEMCYTCEGLELTRV